MTTTNALKIATEILSYRPRLLTLNVKENRFLLIRLTSDDYYNLRKNSIPIEDDGLLMMQLEFRRSEESKLNLAQTFVALESLFGKSGHFFDDYKGSFDFPLFLSLHKNNQDYPYLLCVRDHKGSLEFTLRRVVDEEEKQYNRDVYHKPFAEEFPREEINQLIIHLYGFLQGYIEAIAPSYDRAFFRTIEACWGIYGYQNGEFFEREYENEDEYHDAIALLAKQIGSTKIQ